MKTLTRAVGYLRMSDKKQDKSIPAQRAEIERYATAHGFAIVRWYVDEGISGAENAKRLGFQQLISDAQALGDFAAILVWDQDRFSRFDPMEANHYWYLLRQAGVKIVTVAKGELDFSTLGSWITASVTQHGKNEYLRDLSRNVLRGRLAKARKGKWQHRSAPYGYQIVNGGDLAINEPAAEVVREIFRRYTEEDCSLWDLARDFNQRGIKSPSGKPWKAHSIGNILRRECYVSGKLTQFHNPKGKFNSVVNGEIVTAGEAHECGEGLTVDCPTLISPATWKAARSYRSKRQTQTSPRAECLNALAGLLYCANCGAKMYAGDRARGKHADPKERTFWCSTYHQHGPTACTRNLVHESAVLDFIVGKLQEMVLDPVNLGRIKAELSKQVTAKRQKPVANGAALRKRLADLDRDILAAAKELKRTPDDLYDLAVADLRTLRKEREAVNASLDAHAGKGRHQDSDSAQVVNQALARLMRLRDALKASEPRTVRHALGELVERIDLWFERIPGKKQIRSAFTQGKAQLREVAHLLAPASPPR